MDTMNTLAKQSLELIERLHGINGSYDLDEEDQALRWVGTSLSIAGVPILVSEGDIDEIIETPDITPIPGTKPWVMGVAAFKGGLLPIFSGDVLFRKRPYTGRVRDYCMVVRRPGVYFGITLSHVESDLRLPIEDRIVDHEVDPDFEKFARGGFVHQGQFLAVLDINKLVTDEEISDVSAVRVSSNEGENDE